jgi:hydrogenase expression/formation protein HypC
MQVLEVNGLNARCEAKGIQRTVSLFLLQHETVRPGDMLMIHVGYAIQKISVDAARSAWELYDEMLAAADAPAREAEGA